MNNNDHFTGQPWRRFGRGLRVRFKVRFAVLLLLLMIIAMPQDCVASDSSTDAPLPASMAEQLQTMAVPGFGQWLGETLYFTLTNAPQILSRIIVWHYLMAHKYGLDKASQYADLTERIADFAKDLALSSDVNDAAMRVMLSNLDLALVSADWLGAPLAWQARMLLSFGYANRDTLQSAPRHADQLLLGKATPDRLMITTVNHRQLQHRARLVWQRDHHNPAMGSINLEFIPTGPAACISMASDCLDAPLACQINRLGCQWPDVKLSARFTSGQWQGNFASFVQLCEGATCGRPYVLDVLDVLAVGARRQGTECGLGDLIARTIAAKEVAAEENDTTGHLPNPSRSGLTDARNPPDYQPDCQWLYPGPLDSAALEKVAQLLDWPQAQPGLPWSGPGIIDTPGHSVPVAVSRTDTLTAAYFIGARGAADLVVIDKATRPFFVGLVIAVDGAAYQQRLFMADQQRGGHQVAGQLLRADLTRLAGNMAQTAVMNKLTHKVVEPLAQKVAQNMVRSDQPGNTKDILLESSFTQSLFHFWQRIKGDPSQAGSPGDAASATTSRPSGSGSYKAGSPPASGHASSGQPAGGGVPGNGADDNGINGGGDRGPPVHNGPASANKIICKFCGSALPPETQEPAGDNLLCTNCALHAGQVVADGRGKNEGFLAKEEDRVASFYGGWQGPAWKGDADPEHLAKAGFYCADPGKAQCFSCKAIVTNLPQGKDINRLHEPDCTMLVATPSRLPRPSRKLHNKIASHLAEATLDTFEKRYDTFVNFPKNCPVTAESLAQAGFYYWGEGDKVSCPYCSAVIHQWESGDNAMEVHRCFKSNCRFVLNPKNQAPATDRHPRLSGHGGAACARQPPSADMADLRERLDSFPLWWNNRVPETAENMAIAGFFHTNSGDSAKCFRCGLILRGWEKGDTAEGEHLRHNPYCLFLRNEHRSLLDDYKQRFGTFRLWPKNNPMRPEELARAGFYYRGKDDQVVCFHCKGNLQNWKPGDTALGEHRKYYHYCTFAHSQPEPSLSATCPAGQVCPVGASELQNILIRMGFEKSIVLERVSKGDTPVQENIDHHSTKLAALQQTTVSAAPAHGMRRSSSHHGGQPNPVSQLRGYDDPWHSPAQATAIEMGFGKQRVAEIIPMATGVDELPGYISRLETSQQQSQSPSASSWGGTAALLPLAQLAASEMEYRETVIRATIPGGTQVEKQHQNPSSAPSDDVITQPSAPPEEALLPAAGSDPASLVDDVIREGREAKESITCPICLDRKKNRVLIPCGHAFCAECLDERSKYEQSKNTCAFCCQKVKLTNLLYMN